MKRLLPFLALAAFAHAETDYPITDDSKPRDDVPRGELIQFQFEQSKIFPGTVREVTIYVPKQYDPAKPACVYVNQDGVQWNAPVVFDNLIAKNELPVIVGVFVMHGRVKAADGEKALDRFNRSLEYDGLGSDYARFLLDELLPAVEQKTTGDGRKIVLSKSGNDRDWRLVERCDLRFQRGVGEARCVLARVLDDRNLREPAGRGPASRLDPQV